MNQIIYSQLKIMRMNCIIPGSNTNTISTYALKPFRINQLHLRKIKQNVSQILMYHD